MTRISIGLLLVIVTLLPGFAGAVSEKDFEVQTTENIINLCTAAPGDPLYHQAVNFCHGFLVGAYRYYEAAGSGPAGLKLVCLPNSAPLVALSSVPQPAGLLGPSRATPALDWP